MMIEVGASLGHGYRSNDLAQEDEREADGDDGRVVQTRLPAWEEERGEEAFKEGGGVGGVVAAPVGAEEKGGDGGLGDVVGSGDVELEKMEERDCGEEEGSSPVAGKEETREIGE